MRISDWSSDVCSSDLRHPARRSAKNRSRDRQHAADGGDGEQGYGQRRVRDDARSGADPRTPPVPDSGGDRGQGRRHGRLYLETRRRVEGEASPIPLPLGIGRASRREGGGQDVSISVGAVSLNKKKK